MKTKYSIKKKYKKRLAKQLKDDAARPTPKWVQK